MDNYSSSPSVGNPVIRHTYTADPTVITDNDTVYLYTGHDEAPTHTHNYIMKHWLCFSSKNLAHWTEHPVPLRATDFAWASGDAYASCVVKRHNRYYWYAAVTHATIPGKAIGVAVSELPSGPFADARGSALIANGPYTADGTDNFDPSVCIDDDGQAYIFWGKNTCYYAKLKDNMTELDGGIHTVWLPGFQEGAHIHKRNGWYYLAYGYEFPEKIAYAMSRAIQGPWEFKGILNEIAGNCETNRPAILHFNGQSYLFYHNGALREGGSHRRSVCIDYLHYNADGTIQKAIMTSEGIHRLEIDSPEFV